MKKLTQPIYIIIVCLSAFMFLSSGTPPGDALLVKGEHYYYCEYCGHRSRQSACSPPPLARAIPTAQTKAATSSMKARKRSSTPANIAATSSPR